MNIQEAIRTVIAGNNLTIEESVDVFSEIMSGTATDAQISALIVGLRIKGESAEEITGAASVMRQKATHILPKNRDYIIDTCGTGGDGANTFNISTATAFVAAGAGAVVAKHGNRSVSSKCGSADVLEKLGVKLNISPESMTKCLEEVGISFLFAPSLHKAMKYAINPRKEIGVRTIFNVLGPLTNPALAPSQLLGVFSPDLTETLAIVLKNMKTDKAYVVHGYDSLDEISISAATRISEVNNGKVNTYTIEPEQFGLNKAPISSIEGGDAAFNSEIIKRILNGETGPARDIVLLNSAFAITAAGISQSPSEGFTIAKESIDSGKALKKLKELIDFTNSH
ncbi:MAG: anthranilate phosphoribosyltransferase [Fibrobacter sp.]|nr:anthranilate phosphoribosyltransferase [Fibrobacter sp.]